jgi:hypothetical protein
MKGKVEQVAGHEKEIQDLKKKAAAAAPFSRPSDDSVREDRLLKFLEIRKRMSSSTSSTAPRSRRCTRATRPTSATR